MRTEHPDSVAVQGWDILTGLSTEGQAGAGVGFGLWPEQDKFAFVPTLAPIVT